MVASTDFAQIPEQLVRAGASGRLGVVLGPHLVAGSGFPTPHELWQTVLTRAFREGSPDRLDDLEEAQVLFTEPGNHLDKYALLTTIMGDAFVDGSIVAALRGIQATPTHFHRALAELPALFLATGPDELLQRARTDRGFTCSTTSLDDGDDVRLPGNGDVLALGGTSFNSGILPFARAPLPLTDQHRNRLQKALERISAILFVGFEAKDDELISVLDILANTYSKNGPRRFWLASRDARIRARAAAHDIDPLWLPSAEDTAGFIRALTKRIEKQNADRTSLWPLPEGTPEDIRTALAEGHSALAIADLASAAERGLLVWENSAPDKQPQIVLEALSLLYFALRRTLFEEPPEAALIPVERRGRVLDVLEKGLVALGGIPRWGKLAFEAAKALASWTLDETTLLSRFDNESPESGELPDNISKIDRTDTIIENDGENPDSSDDPPDVLMTALRLAQSGAVDDALAQIPQSNHPWHAEFYRSFVLSRSQQSERALVAILGLCRRFPGRAFIEELAAALLNKTGRVEEALVHAQLAFDEFPSRGNRHLLGSILARLGRSVDAWRVLKPLQDTKDQEFIRTLNQVAGEVTQSTAESLPPTESKAPVDDKTAEEKFNASRGLSGNEILAFFYFYEEFGSPSFESLSVETGKPFGSLFNTLATEAPHRILPGLALAIEPRIRPPIKIANRRILCGPLELCLISYLELWEPLKAALKPHGKLLVFDDIAERISSKISELATPSDVELKRGFDEATLNGLIEFIERPRPSNGRTTLEHIVNNAQASIDITSDLAYFIELANDPELRYLCADAFCYSEEGVNHEAEAMFHDAAAARGKGADGFHEQVITVPQVVRAIFASDRQHALLGEKLFSLAELGFADAIGPQEILHLSRCHGNIDRDVPMRILQRSERFVWQREHRSRRSATMIIARHYSGAIWDAACNYGDFTEADARTITASLLHRSEELDAIFQSAILNRIFEHLAHLSIMGRVSAAPNEQRKLHDFSVASSLWAFLSAWAGPSGRRRAAMNTGLRRIWFEVDMDTDGVGISHQGIEPLLIASFGTQTMPLNLQGAAASAAILTATWTPQILGELDIPIHANQIGKHASIRLGGLLAQVADALNAGLVKMTDTTCIAHISLDGESREVPITVPPEAAILRASPSACIDAARVLARLQGPHDGRAYERLMALATNPRDSGLSKRCAREAIFAPYLLVREDPTILFQWSRYQTPGLPLNLSELCAMLSEPTRDESDRSLRQELDLRMATGAWHGRSDQHQLLNQAAQVPGATSQYGMDFQINASNLALRIANALHVLDHGNEYPIGKLSSNVLFLRVIAERIQHISLPQGDIDIRERFPERLVNLLDVVEQAPKEGTLAAYEAGLLRFCATQVSRLDHDSDLSPRHHLWLTYRLFQWIVAQLDTLTPTAKLAAFEVLARGLPGPAVEQASDDLLDPAGFERESGIDYRLVTILYAMSQMNVVAKETADEEQEASEVKAWRFSSPMLEQRFAKLAARPFTKRELRLRAKGQTPTSFDWDAPGTVPDLAMLALVTSRREGFARIVPDARLRWIRDLPEGPQDTTQTPWFLARALYPAINAALPRLGAEESLAYEEKLRGLEGNAEALRWRWLGLTALFRTGRGKVTEEEVLTLLLEHLEAKVAPKVFGWALLGVAQKNVEHLESFIRRVLDTAMERKLDPVPLAEGITFVVALSKIRAAITKAREIFLAWNERPPFQGDERMKKLAAQFGLS